jgi:hypothetical protein
MSWKRAGELMIKGLILRGRWYVYVPAVDLPCNPLRGLLFPSPVKPFEAVPSWYRRLQKVEDLRRSKIEVLLRSPSEIADLRQKHLCASWPTVAIRSDDLSVRSVKHQ